MKTKFLLFTLLLSLNFFSQKKTYNEDSIAFYFIKSLDSFRLVKHKTIPKLIHNKNADIACLHHNNYMIEMKKEKEYFISHYEVKSENGFTYEGKDTLIENFYDRIEYYNTNKDFDAAAEVIGIDWYYWYLKNNKNEKYIAEQFLIGFLNSREHCKIISSFNYTAVGINVKQHKDVIYLTMVVGFYSENIDNKKVWITNKKIN